jgi:hypothetical protein
VRQLTIRGFDEEIEAAIGQISKREGISLNQAAIRLLREGVRSMGSRRIGSSLDRFAGTWTRTQARRFLESISELEEIDEEMWK